MNYEQKYKEALGWMQSLYDGLHGPTKEDAEHYFPELVESEDDRIRKEIISALKYANYKGVYNKHLAWLEKQGEHKPYGQRKECEDCQFNYAGECKGYCALKRNEQTQLDYEHADIPQKDFAPIEPKFKVGDWVVTDYGRVSRVVSVDKYGDGYTLDDGVYFSGSWCDMYHLWSINDAKDGDVLVDVYGNIGIYKSHDDFDWTSYCSLGCNEGFQNFKVEHENENTHPATKEQRDLLFEKMKEAGYEWRQEEKKLIKMKETKFNVGDWIVTDDSFGKIVRHVDEISSNIIDERYGLSDEYGLTYNLSFDKEHKWHKWTIQDAKDGDVLVDSYSKDSIIILYKGIYKERSILAHCGWNGYNLSIKTNELGYGGLDNTNYLPATKEQRDLLFEKMKEAGYEWDAEKKVLLKRDMEILPEAKMQAYIKYCNDKSPSNIFCDKCNKSVTIEREYPYFYDKDENDVYFASICPECGELLITKE